MNKKYGFLNFLIWTFVLLFHPRGLTAQQPNIIFLLTDDQTTNTLGCYGHSLPQTPNIDALASQGTRFENAFVSQSICWVSRTSILTGLTGRSYGEPHDPDLTRPEIAARLYSDVMRNHGYHVGFFGKWHAKMPAGYRPADHFDVYEAISRNPYFKTMPDGSLKHETDLIIDRGIEFITQRPQDKPFMLNLWFNACHAEDEDRRPGIGHFPWPESANQLYPQADSNMPPPPLNDPAIFEALPDFLKTSITRERFFWRWNTDWKYDLNMRAYLRMVNGIDNAVGRLLASLEEHGLSENTIIVYSTDNGYHMGNRGLAGKWSHFEESLRIPLIIYDPRVEPKQKGNVNSAMVLNLDFPATFLDWAGIAIPDQYQGRSLTTLVEGSTPEDWRTETFHEHFAVRQRIPAWEGIRTERFKYARYFDHGDFEFLHDLQSDPYELVNLAGDPAFAETLNTMREKTAQQVAQLGGPLAPLPAAFSPSTQPHPSAAAAVTIRQGSDGFVTLFNGKNLNGWSGDSKYWSVKDGAIVGANDGSLTYNRFLTWTGSTIQNFDLRVEVKVTPDGNSGIQYRSLPRPEIGLDVLSGYQCDIVGNHREYDGMMYEERGRRILGYNAEKTIVDTDGQAWVIEDLPKKDFPAGQWHEYRVRVEGNHHRHWINDHLIAEMIDLDEKGRALEGVLGFQLHSGGPMEVRFRKIRIQHLPDDLPLKLPSEHPIPIGSAAVKPQGMSREDWQPTRYGQPVRGNDED